MNRIAAIAALFFFCEPSPADDFPVVVDGFEVSLFASDPLVRNPCAIAFDAKGRLCVGMGPQYRRPTPETDGDTVYILIDDDDDGSADRRVKYATGLNAIQGLAWKGDELWIANAPDLTVVRDVDGDDEADEYVRLYTDLGNLEHGLHGLNWAPDGKLYMSKGNSKGLASSADRMAPKPFRDLWGMNLPEDTPAFPQPVTFQKGNYQKNYHHPSDDWGLCGGVLRCDPGGSNLEIVSRGFRNPWDIAFDDAFNWLGTDNDQTLGDKLFSPFFGADFGWGHPWSFDWKGDDHLPSAPSAGPLFEGSGTGVIFCSVPGYPDKYNGVFLVNDWLRRELYVCRPTWDGAWMKIQGEEFEVLAHADGGRSMEKSSGRSFDPVDIEVGPDGAIYISSWGRQYGAISKDGRMVNEGRIYKIWPKAFQLVKADPKRKLPIGEWNSEQLTADLSGFLPVWRVNAQDELIRRGNPIEIPVSVGRQFQTWALWTNARMPSGSDVSIDADAPRNIRIQSLRILAHRGDAGAKVAACLTDESARIRHEAVLALHQADAKSHGRAIVELVATEQDRIVFYSAWQSLRKLLSVAELKELLADPRPGVRRGAILALLEDDAMSDAEITLASRDGDSIVSSLAKKRLGGKARGIIKGAKLVGTEVEKRPPFATRYKPLAVVGDIQPRRSGRYEEAVLHDGAIAYSDRPYRITEVPKSLVGETFIRAANNDADPHHGTGFALDLLYPSTVFLADDNRGEKLPAWARGRFAKTEMRLVADGMEYSIHKADYPAGQTSFGPNRDDVTGRKGHYILIVQPKPLNPPNEPTTHERVLPLIADANVEHGRNLFFQKSGATCSLCHKLEERGNVYAPDLSDIGTRADAESIVRSILEPSADITEGFAMQIITRKDGTSIGGIVLEETGRHLKMSPGAGSVVDIAKSGIASREGAEISAMPAIFHTLLQPEDVAALTRYLLEFKTEAQAAAKQVPAPSKPDAAPTRADELAGKSFGSKSGFEIHCRNDRLDISLNDKPLAQYFYRHDKVWRPFFANLKTPGGLQVTRNFPPQEGDPEDHWDMHPGLSLGFAVLDGVNFWHNREGSVVHQGFDRLICNGDQAEFTALNRYLDGSRRELCKEVVSYRIGTNADGYLLTVDTRITASEAIFFGVKEEMGFTLRVATPITVKHGKGSILSASGGKDEKGTWGKVDSWWDYFGPIGDTSSGIHIMSAPGNPEVWSHSRDYGVLVANPFPVDIKENRGKKVSLSAGESLHLQFGVQIHEHANRAQYDPGAAFERYLEAIQR